MLDDFIKTQPIAYKILNKSKKKNKVSHAYIIETNGYSKGLDLAIAFSKYLLCPNSYTNSEKCQNCTQCFTIDKNEFIELKIIEADGNQIKKDQIENLQLDFSKKPVIGDKKIYIVNGAEKLNSKTSNSILKFIEEPEEGIIAILITENVNNLLSTIVSRCQIISLNNKKDNLNLSTQEKIKDVLILNDEQCKDLFTKDDEEKTKLDRIINFVNYYEKNGSETIIYTQKLFHQYFTDREDFRLAFEIILLFYKDILNTKLNQNLIFSDFMNDLDLLSNKNSLEKLLNKINVISNLKDKIKYNANATLLLDKLIIELEGCEKI